MAYDPGYEYLALPVRQMRSLCSRDRQAWCLGPLWKPEALLMLARPPWPWSLTEEDARNVLGLHTDPSVPAAMFRRLAGGLGVPAWGRLEPGKPRTWFPMTRFVAPQFPDQNTVVFL